MTKRRRDKTGPIWIPPDLSFMTDEELGAHLNDCIEEFVRRKGD
jgi:hypothetical protein